MSGRSVKIQFEEGKRSLLVASIGPFAPSETTFMLNWEQTWALMAVCKYCFEDSEGTGEYSVPNHLWEGTGFHFMAPLPENQETFMFWFGPVASFIPTLQIRKLYEELKLAFKRLNSFELFD